VDAPGIADRQAIEMKEALTDPGMQLQGSDWTSRSQLKSQALALALQFQPSFQGRIAQGSTVRAKTAQARD
jgi:hypothetical protein